MLKTAASALDVEDPCQFYFRLTISTHLMYFIFLFFQNKTWIRSVLTLSEKWFGHWWPSKKKRKKIWIQQQHIVKKKTMYLVEFSLVICRSMPRISWRHTCFARSSSSRYVFVYWAVIALVLINSIKLVHSHVDAPKWDHDSDIVQRIACFIILGIDVDNLWKRSHRWHWVTWASFFFLLEHSIYIGMAMCDLSSVADKLSASFFNLW